MEKYDRTKFGLEGICPNAQFKVTVFHPGVIRIQATRAQEFEDFSYAVIAKPVDTDFVIADHADHLTITFEDPKGLVINQDDDGFGISWIESEVTNYKMLQEGERFIIFWEKTGNLDRRGSGYLNWNTDSFSYSKQQDPLYSSTPFYISIP